MVVSDYAKYKEKPVLASDETMGMNRVTTDDKRG